MLMRKILEYLTYVRSRASRGIIFSSTTLMATFVASRGSPPILPALMITAASFLITMGIYISNDIADLEIDVANRVNRPLAQGKLSKRDVMLLSMLLYLSGIIIGYIINPLTFLICILGIILGITYSFEPLCLKKKFMIKHAAVAGGAFIASAAGGAAVNNLSLSILFAGSICFLYGLASTVIFDLGDILGDGMEGRKTLPIVWGPDYTIRFAIALILAIIISGILGYMQIGFNLAFPILSCVACLSTIYVIYPLFNRWRDQTFCHKIRRKLILLYLTLQLSFALGSL